MTSNTKWQLSGNAAELYEQYLVPTIFVPWASQLLTEAHPQTGEDVLDVACGTGIVARMAKVRVGDQGRVVGVDLNGGMLEVAKNLSAATDIDWIEADVGTIPLPDNSFDVAFCQQGLQFFPEKIAALKEIHRLLRPGGRCVVCVAQALDKNPLMRSQVEAITKHIGEEAAGAIRAVCGLPDGQTIKSLFLEADFNNVAWKTVSLNLHHENGREFITNALASTPLAGLIADWSDEERDRLVDDILIGFGDHYDGAGLHFPHVSSVVFAN